MATTLEIIRGISQAAANAYDGAHMEGYSSDGKARTIGLKREEGNPITDKRVMDGFGVSFHGDKLKISYHSEVQLREVYGTSFETDTEAMIDQVANFLKKEYKVITGDTLSLTSQGDADIVVQNTSRVRTWCQACKFYKIMVGLPRSDRRMIPDLKSRQHGLPAYQKANISRNSKVW